MGLFDGSDRDEAAVHSEREGSLTGLAVSALVVGAAAGLVGAMFRLALEQADHLRNLLIGWAQARAVLGFLVVVAACSAASFVAAWLVRRFSPYAAGSGIPHVEAVLHGQIPPAPYGLAPTKFVGGLLAIGSGLALGREGPSVQMGASIAVYIGRLFRRSWPDCRVLLAAGAGAGLATAFNAPIAGAVFVLEELVRRYEPRIAIAALAASATAIAIARLLIGDVPDFAIGSLHPPHAGTGPLFFVFGGVLGLLAIAYNRTLLATTSMVERLGRRWIALWSGVVGATVGAVAWFAPDLVGGGDVLTQNALTGGGSMTLVAMVLLVRFGLGAISYSAGTPGGLFAPLLVIGAQSGLLFGGLCRSAFPALNIQPEGFAVVGLAAFFAGVVRAPITGIVLVTEMTADVTFLLPMLGASFGAMLVTTALNDPPIYDSLRAGILRRHGTS